MTFTKRELTHIFTGLYSIRTSHPVEIEEIKALRIKVETMLAKAAK